MKARLSSLLDDGAIDFPGAKLLSSAWAHFSSRDIARPIPTPAGTRLITIGGATLGGSGKTPLAIALARSMAARGEGVALVGHAYGAKPGRARRVTSHDDVREVGDEALVAARHLEGTRASVVVAGARSAAVNFAASLATTLILDGPLQARPVPAYRSLLAVDAAKPWGSGLHPPRGDLRAPPMALLLASDIVVALGDRSRATLDSSIRPVLHVTATLAPEGTLSRSKPVSLASLTTARVGLLLGLARPVRVIEDLAKIGIRPLHAARFRDHALPSKRFLDRAAIVAREERLDAWLATEKCATRLPPHIGNVPVVAVAKQLDFSGSELDFIEDHAGGRHSLP